MKSATLTTFFLLCFTQYALATRVIVQHYFKEADAKLHDPERMAAPSMFEIPDHRAQDILDHPPHGTVANLRHIPGAGDFLTVEGALRHYSESAASAATRATASEITGRTGQIIREKRDVIPDLAPDSISVPVAFKA